MRRIIAVAQALKTRPNNSAFRTRTTSPYTKVINRVPSQREPGFLYLQDKTILPIENDYAQGDLKQIALDGIIISINNY